MVKSWSRTASRFSQCLACCLKVTTARSEGLCTGEAVKRAGYLVVEFHHPEAAFRDIVGEWHGCVVEQPEEIVFRVRSRVLRTEDADLRLQTLDSAKRFTQLLSQRPPDHIAGPGRWRAQRWIDALRAIP